MPQKLTGLRRPFAVEVLLDPEEREFVKRMAYRDGMSQSEFIRRGGLNCTRETIEVKLEYLRGKQKKVKGLA